MIRTIDLCCGAGGWACAGRGLPIQWAAVADQAADCLETWQLNHGAAHPDCRLVREDLATTEGMDGALAGVGKIDLVCGAIPCEQVSHARGNRLLKPGEMEAVHALIDQCFRAVKILRPRWWIFEDVAAIIPHLPLPLVESLPYEIRTINAALYGPQSRIRVFFGRFPPPAAPEPGPRTLGEVLRPGPYRTLPQLDKYERSNSRWYGGDKLRVQDPAGKAGVVISSQGGCGSRAERSGMVPLVRVQDADQPSPTVMNVGSRHERAALAPLSIQDRPQDTNAPVPAVVSGKGDRIWPVNQDGLVRVLEWQEAALLQGFPTDYVFAASWSRTWKLVAQAIPIQVGRAILQAIVNDQPRPKRRKRP